MQCHVLVMFHTSAVNLQGSNSVEHKTPLVHLLCSVCVTYHTENNLTTAKHTLDTLVTEIREGRQELW